MGWFQMEGLLFLPGNLHWKLVNSLHATTHLGEKALQRLLERSLRGTGLQMTIRQVVSSCPPCQLNNPQGARSPQLAQHIQQWGTYPGAPGAPGALLFTCIAPKEQASLSPYEIL